MPEFWRQSVGLSKFCIWLLCSNTETLLLQIPTFMSIKSPTRENVFPPSHCAIESNLFPCLLPWGVFILGMINTHGSSPSVLEDPALLWSVGYILDSAGPSVLESDLVGNSPIRGLPTFSMILRYITIRVTQHLLENSPCNTLPQCLATTWCSARIHRA